MHKKKKGRDMAMEQLSIRPEGWLKTFLLNQMDGLTGHIAVAGEPFDKEWWGNREAESYGDKTNCWWPYEQTAYWLDGFTRCAVLLDDRERLAEAQRRIRAVLEDPDEDGYLGPRFLKAQGRQSRWPHAVFFRACMALYDGTHDPTIPAAIKRHYLGSPYDYSQLRDVQNVEILLWLYRLDGDPALLKLAEDSYRKYNLYPRETVRNADRMCDDTILHRRKVNIHGVTYNEYMKLGALLYHCTGKTAYRRVSEKALEKLDRYYMLPGQCCSSSEYLLGNKYWDSYELCDISDYTWSLENMMEVLDNPGYADRIERCIFNAGVGSVTEDCRALQYFSCGNQLVIDEQSNHNYFKAGESFMAYAPLPGTACCTGNMSRFMPNFVSRMWRVRNGVLCADLLGPGTVTLGDTAVTVDTSYPLENTLRFSVTAGEPVRLRLRLPGWCTGYTLDGAGGDKKDSFLYLTVDGGSTFTLELQDKIEIHQLPEGVYFAKGALIYCLGMKGTRSAYKTARVDEKEFPSYRMLPNKSWNYALRPWQSPKFHPGNSDRFDTNTDLPGIDVRVNPVPEWQIRESGLIHTRDDSGKHTTIHRRHTFTPRIPVPDRVRQKGKTQTIRLLPYGACKVRMTVLPLGSDNRKDNKK